MSAGSSKSYLLPGYIIETSVILEICQPIHILSSSINRDNRFFFFFLSRLVVSSECFFFSVITAFIFIIGSLRDLTYLCESYRSSLHSCFFI